MYARDTWTQHATSPNNISRYVNCSFINVALSHFVANVYANKRSCAFVLYEKVAIRWMETDVTIWRGLIALQVVISFFFFANSKMTLFMQVSREAEEPSIRSDKFVKVEFPKFYHRYTRLNIIYDDTCIRMKILLLF